MTGSLNHGAHAENGAARAATTPTKGRLFGRNVLEGTFRAAPDEDLFLGELLVAIDEATGRRYLFRIVDVTYGTEHREPGWAERVAGTRSPSFGAVVPGYLSPRHRDDPGHGCLFAALGSDVVRQPRSVRRAVTEGLRSRLEALQKLLPGRSAAARRDKALVTLAGLVGALMLSRAVDDPKLSDDILEAAAATLGRA